MQIFRTTIHGCLPANFGGVDDDEKTTYIAPHEMSGWSPGFSRLKPGLQPDIPAHARYSTVAEAFMANSVGEPIVSERPTPRALWRTGLRLLAGDDHLPGPDVLGLGANRHRPRLGTQERCRSELRICRVLVGLRPVRGAQRLAGRHLRPAAGAHPHRAVVVGVHCADGHRGPQGGRHDAGRPGAAGRHSVSFRGGRGGGLSEHYPGPAQLVSDGATRLRPGGGVDVRPDDGRPHAFDLDVPDGRAPPRRAGAGQRSRGAASLAVANRFPAGRAVGHRVVSVLRACGSAIAPNRNPASTRPSWPGSAPGGPPPRPDTPASPGAASLPAATSGCCA